MPVIALTRGWRGLYLITRDGEEEIPGLPRQEVDPTGAGDVFAATFLMRYQETGEPGRGGGVRHLRRVVRGGGHRGHDPGRPPGDRAAPGHAGADLSRKGSGRSDGQRRALATDEGRGAALYERNRQRGTAAWCGHDYDFVCPSTGTYPFQWFWDSCFHAVALAHIDVERARSEVRSLLRNAQPDGFVAHVTFWQREAYEEMLKTYSIAYRTPYLSDCIQPPVLAEAVAAAAQGAGGDAFLAEVLPAVRRYFDWLHRVRDPDGDGLIATLQPDESGLDHTPKYDAYLGITGTATSRSSPRPGTAWPARTPRSAAIPQRMFALDRFVVEDVLVNTIYGENQRVLGDLLERVGDAAGRRGDARRAAATTAALVDEVLRPRARACSSTWRARRRSTSR